jgi:hypothetical protein
MGNNSSNPKDSSNNQNKDGNISSSSAAKRIQKALPTSLLKSGPSSSVIQTYLDQAHKSKTLKLKQMGIKNIPVVIEQVRN